MSSQDQGHQAAPGGDVPTAFTESAWRPIETAPVNVVVVALYRGDIPVIAHQNSPKDNPSGWCHANVCDGNINKPHRGLTHWMPLPPAPTVSREATTASSGSDVPIPSDVLDFLFGKAPLEGVWFGEPHPTRKGGFWWRSVITERLGKSLSGDLVGKEKG